MAIFVTMKLAPHLLPQITVAVGSTMAAERFLTLATLQIILLGLVAFME